MTRYEAQAEIARSADEVWTYAADILRHPEWMAVSCRPGFCPATERRSGPAGLGGRSSVRFKSDIEFEVAEAEPGRRLQWRSTDPRFDYVVTLDLEPVGPADSRARVHGGLRHARRLAAAVAARRARGRAGIQRRAGAAQGAGRVERPGGRGRGLLTFEALQGLLRR